MSFRVIHPEFDAVVDACCQLSKQDVPEVEAVIDVVLPILEELWPDTADNLVQIALERVGGLERPLQADEDSTALEDLVLAILGALELRLGLVLPLEGQQAVLAATERLLAAGGASVGATPSLAAVGTAGLPQTGLGDLELALRGRLQLRRQEVAQVLREAVLSAEPVATFEGRLQELLGRATAGWLPFVVDTWAYRWFNVGAFVGGRQQGVGAFRIFNNPPAGPDERTTPFCWWVHQKLVPVSRVETQLVEMERAIRGNNIRLAMRAWPLWRTDDGTTPTDFANFFLRAGLPPYHGKCRSVARPA